ncbi:MAG: ribosome biogenesis GTP-binding protein YihA/YsxC [Bacteroidota bacterium]|nr:ribosome biogenesis GTP-binding protein YihA/YsxC [Bacteroidota bacterium]MEC8513698.1 ribosome biogenesis GTP-binding protein YihA/YsxC [Bacteroidota bacterium]
MVIHSADFLCSNTDWKKCPDLHLPEYAFIGRSNVGKSSLINSLTNNKKLAKTSGRPGKTQLINHFKINNSFLFADLPGYGYAKVSKKTRASFQEFTLRYLEKRKNLICLFLLIDLRISPQKIDLEFMEYCAVKQIPFIICFTKADKIKKREVESKVTEYQNKLKETWEEIPFHFITSSISKVGCNDVLMFIRDQNKLFH